MEILIKYRNERKNEGATAGELNGLDGRINAMMSSSSGDAAAKLDVELLLYRRQLVAEGKGHYYEWQQRQLVPEGPVSGQRQELLERLDATLFHLLGSRPARVVEVYVQTIGDSELKGFPVSVDLANETVGDLASKAAAVLGWSSTAAFRIILRGKHLGDLGQTLSEAHVRPKDRVFLCLKLGCNGRCCEMNYSLMADGLLRDVRNVLHEVSPEELHKAFVVVSHMRATASTAVPAAAAPVQQQPQGLIRCENFGNEPLSAGAARFCELLSEARATSRYFPAAATAATATTTAAATAAAGAAAAAARAATTGRRLSVQFADAVQALGRAQAQWQGQAQEQEQSEDEDLYG